MFAGRESVKLQAAMVEGSGFGGAALLVKEQADFLEQIRLVVFGAGGLLEDKAATQPLFGFEGELLGFSELGQLVEDFELSGGVAVPASAASRAVISEPDRGAASTTTVPGHSPAMIRLR